jgi:cycloeucalenol cycloisomerase
MAAVVFSLSYATALAETLTIAHFPYYTFVDRSKMYTVGSLFYAIYFFVSFPMFYRIDEGPAAGGRPARRWTLAQVCFDALAAAMLVTLLLDTWRIAFGGIVDSPASRKGLTWA